MIKEFTTEQLYVWRAQGIRYIGIRLQRPELLIDEETDEFMVMPFTALQDAEMFLSGQTGEPASLDDAPHYFPIDSGEAYEIAAGVSGCKFYVKSA